MSSHNKYNYKIEDLSSYIKEKKAEKLKDYIITKKEVYEKFDDVKAPYRKRDEERQQVHDDCIAKIKSAMNGEIEWEDWMNGFLEGKI